MSDANHPLPELGEGRVREGDQHLLLEQREAVAIVRLNRPEVRNVINQAMLADLADLLERLDADASVRVIVICGDERAFAAGADVREMVDAGPVEMYQRPQRARWQRIRRIQKPLIAAVSGYALGGGNELVMACDLVVAAESARFGQPEINLGILPGGGATQRLPRFAGKARAMELILTGRIISAAEAFEIGLVSRVVPDDRWFDEALELADEIARKPPIAVQLAKEAVLKAFDTSLEAGLDFERRLFNLAFATVDREEGMRAFLEKRQPRFEGR